MLFKIAALRSVHHELLEAMVDPSPLRTVSLDFSNFVDTIEEPTYSPYSNAFDVSVGMHPFRCYFPGNETTCGAPDHLSWLTETADEWVRNERRNFLTLSKIAPFLGRCFTYKPSVSDVWSYSLCVGREIVKYRGARIMSNDMKHLGHHNPDLDEVFINGTLIQHYVDGHEGLETSIRFECSEEPVKVTGFNGTQFTVESPHFCDWRSNHQVPLDRLLMDDVGSCFNLTADYWTYEYCHPDSLLQFHLERDETIKTPMFLMGSLRSQLSQMPAPSAAFPFVRSAKPWNKSPEALQELRKQFKHLPLEIIRVPLSLLAGAQMWPREAGARGLALYLNEGSPCPEIPARVRTTRVIFICPGDMVDHKGFRLVTVRESRTCQYDLLIETPHVCTHPLLRPALPELPDTIRCFRRRNELKFESELLGDFEMSPKSKSAIEDFILKMTQSKFEVPSSERQLRREIISELVTNLNWYPSAAGLKSINDQLTDNHHVTDDNQVTPYSSGRVSRIQLIEHLPSVIDFESEDFCRSKKIRMRSKDVTFRIGDVVHHEKFNYTGVVTGWDATAQVTEDWFSWIAGLYQLNDHREERRLLRSPWYLLDVPPPRVEEDVDFLQAWAHQSYVPDPYLRWPTDEESRNLLNRVAAGWRPSGFSSYAHFEGRLRFLPPNAVGTLRSLYPFDAIPVVE